MEKKTLAWLMLVFGLMGTLFAGYLYFSKLLLGTCPLTEPCPIAFFGQPACLYGFIMFLAILGSSLMYLANKNEDWIRGVKFISFLGIVYGLYFSIKDLFFTACPLTPTGQCHYSLGLPSCVYGLIMFIAVHVISFCFFKGCCEKKTEKKTVVNKAVKKAKKKK
jgi:hypothetical protein